MTKDEKALVDRVSHNWGSNEIGLLVALVRRLDAENERHRILMREAAALLRELSEALGPAPENVGCAQNSAINLADRLDGKA